MQKFRTPRLSGDSDRLGGPSRLDRDPLTGLGPVDRLQAAARVAWRDQSRRAELVVVVVELGGSPARPASRFERARRLAVAGDMARGAFGQALAVGRLGTDRVGVLALREPALAARTELLARMVADLPATVEVVPLPGSPAVAASLLEELSA